MKYKIREMTTNDIRVVVKGEKKVFGKSLGYDMLYQELTINPFAFYFVIEIDKKVRGYIGLWINENAEIINFYIDKKYQNQGFGEILLNFALSICEKTNQEDVKIKNISLEVRKSNRRAINLYKKYGFVIGNIRKKYYDDGEDAIVMIKDFEVKNDRIRC